MTMQTSGWAEWVGAITAVMLPASQLVSGLWVQLRQSPSQSGLWAGSYSEIDLQGSVNASNLGGSSWYILESSKVKDVAIDFMKETYCKDVDFYQTILVNNGCRNIPAFTERRSLYAG